MSNKAIYLLEIYKTILRVSKNEIKLEISILLDGIKRDRWG